LIPVPIFDIAKSTSFARNLLKKHYNDLIENLKSSKKNADTSIISDILNEKSSNLEIHELPRVTNLFSETLENNNNQHEKIIMNLNIDLIKKITKYNKKYNRKRNQNDIKNKDLLDIETTNEESESEELNEKKDPKIDRSKKIDLTIDSLNKECAFISSSGNFKKDEVFTISNTLNEIKNGHENNSLKNNSFIKNQQAISYNQPIELEKKLNTSESISNYQVQAKNNFPNHQQMAVDCANNITNQPQQPEQQLNQQLTQQHQDNTNQSQYFNSENQQINLYDQMKYYESNKMLFTNSFSESQNILPPPQPTFLPHQLYQPKISSSYEIKTKNPNEIMNFQQPISNATTNIQNVYYGSHQNNHSNLINNNGNNGNNGNNNMKYQGYNYPNNMNNQQYLINTNQIQHQPQPQPVQNMLPIQNNSNQYYTQQLMNDHYKNENQQHIQSSNRINHPSQLIKLPNPSFSSSQPVLNSSNYSNYPQVNFFLLFLNL